MRMITKKKIEEALEKFLDNYDENVPSAIRTLAEDIADIGDSHEAHRRKHDLKKQALTNENNFDCKGCA